MKLNCDLGESYGSWSMGLDEQVMPFIDQANIATGFHAGDPLTLRNTLQLASRHGVAVGAHPAYPDLVGFGRRSMNLSAEELTASLHYQIAAVDGMAASQGLSLSYVKPHGALYNDMMARADILDSVMQALASYHRPLAFMLQATAASEQHRKTASGLGLNTWFEAFADRCYADDGKLLSRSKAGAVHSREKMLAQVAQLKKTGTVTTASGKQLAIAADSLCVHGDNADGVQAIQEIRALIA